MADKPWYHEGLAFRCTGCGQCCTGDPGYVWVIKAEIDALARTMDLEDSEFERAFVRRVGVRRSLLELPNGDCVFFDRVTRRCRVYEVRPRQCRTWPFWGSNIRSSGDWEEICRVCPGIGEGPVFPLEQIDTQAATVRV